MTNEFMTRAIELAEAAIKEKTGGPFGAVVVCQGRIVGEGQNRVLQRNDPTAHAEVEAIRAASTELSRFDLSDCELFSSCEPCPMCLGATYWARLSVVHYAATRFDAAAIGFDDARFYEELSRSPDARVIPLRMLERDSALGVFAQWEQLDERRKY